MSKGYWWDKFPNEFYKSTYKTVLDEHDKLKITTTAALDKVCRTALATFVLSTMKKQLLSNDLFEKELESLAFYKDFAKVEDAAEVFIEPPKDVEIHHASGSYFFYRPKNVAHVDSLYFKSPFQTLNLLLNEDYSKSINNQKVIAQHWRHGDQPRATLIFIHGVVVDSYGVNNQLFALEWFYSQGYDVLLYTLPFHGDRKEYKDLISGSSFFSKGFAHINEAMLQSVFDLRIWMNYLQKNGVNQIGVMGFSLGGYISSLLASVDERLSFAIPFAPMVLPIDMLMSWPLISPILKKVMNKHEIDVRYLRQVTAIHHALNWRPRINAQRLLVIGGAGDRFTSPSFVNALHQHWQGSEMYWYKGNHILFLNHKQVLHKIKKFMDQCCEMH